VLVQSVTDMNRCYWRSKFYIVGVQIFDLFSFRDLDVMTCIYQLCLYSLEKYRMCENELRLISRSTFMQFLSSLTFLHIWKYESWGYLEMQGP